MTDKNAPPKLNIRSATQDDIEDIIALQQRAYGGLEPDTPGMLRGRLARFPEGQIVIEMDGKLAGWCSSFIIDEASAFDHDHTLDGITGHGYLSRHTPAGDWLYGAEVAVDPEVRRIRIGQRLYDARRRLCEELGLKGIVFGALEAVMPAGGCPA